jgi:hypothetical protein
MFLNQLSLLARSVNRLRAGVALTALLAACGPAPEAVEEPEAPVAAQPQAIVSQSCLRAFQQCNARCARLEAGGDPQSICYADCTEQFYLCQCRTNPQACFGS